VTLRQIPALVGATVTAWQAHKAGRLAAALAYYSLFSLAPLAVVVLWVARLFYGDSVAADVSERLTAALGSQAAEAVQTLITGVVRHPQTALETVIVVVGLLFGATGVFRNLKDALNTAWDIPPREAERGFPGALIGIARTQAVSFVMVVGVGVLLLVALAASSVVSFLAQVAAQSMPFSSTLIQIVDLVVSFILFTVVFALTFRVLPDRKITWAEVGIGAAVTSFLFTLGRFAIGLYLGISRLGSVYGALSSVLVLLVWIYYSAQIYLLGAEFTHVYATRFRKEAAAEDGYASPGGSESPRGG
jgi:membrane protein